ncbi:hypothetical protein KKD70_00205, partial [Patescibacteria group bacterium]|nr:hypothetical protein [Patescibacteria group bacterium]
ENLITKIDELNKPEKDLGRYMYRCLGIMPPTLKKTKPVIDKANPKSAVENKEEATSPYLSALMVQLRYSGFKYLYSDKAIVAGMLKENQKGQRQFYENDPIFFKLPNGQFTGGFIKGFRDGKIIIQTIETNKQGVTQSLTKEMPQDQCLAAFHINGNRTPITNTNKPAKLTK